MDKLEQLRRLTGHVETAGRRALNVERTHTEAERQLAEAHGVLRELHAELTRPPHAAEAVPADTRAGPFISEIAVSRHEIALARVAGERDAPAQAEAVEGAGPDEPARPRRFGFGKLALLLVAGTGVAGGALALVEGAGAPMQYLAGLAIETKQHTKPAAAATAGGQAIARSAARTSPVTTVETTSGARSAGSANSREPPAVKPSPVVTIETATAAVAVASLPPNAAGMPVGTSRDDQTASGATPAPPPIALAPSASTVAADVSAAPLVATQAPPTSASSAPAAVEDSFYAKRFAKISAGERECLAQAVYYEARGEPVAGQIAVAQVILNRTMSGSWPVTVCGVVHQGQERGERCQFSFACMRSGLAKPHGEAWQQSSWIANEVLSGGAWLRELTEATHYHRTDLAPVWRLALKEIGKIGIHVFYSPPGSKQVLGLAIAGDGGAGQHVPFAASPTTAASSIVRRQDIGRNTSATIKRRKEAAGGSSDGSWHKGITGN